MSATAAPSTDNPPIGNGLPTVPLDMDSLYEDQWRGLTYELRTPAGAISIEIRMKKLYCVGAQETLIAYGLVRPEWLPGIPGNGFTANSVVFDAAGPRVVVGKVKGLTKLPRINIQAWGYGRRTVRVVLSMTPEQLADVEAWVTQKQQQAEEQERWQKRERDGVTQYRTSGNVIYLQPRS